MSARLMLIDALRALLLLLLALLLLCKGLPGVLSIALSHSGIRAMPITFVTTVKKIASPILACSDEARKAQLGIQSELVSSE